MYGDGGDPCEAFAFKLPIVVGKGVGCLLSLWFFCSIAFVRDVIGRGRGIKNRSYLSDLCFISLNEKGIPEMLEVRSFC